MILFGSLWVSGEIALLFCVQRESYEVKLDEVMDNEDGLIELDMSVGGGGDSDRWVVGRSVIGDW
jgi:hypothetical protein